MNADASNFMPATFPAVRRFVNNDNIGKTSACICHRPSATIVCSECGKSSVGRISRTCAVHPNVFYLMDNSCCMHCRAPYFLLREENLLNVANTSVDCICARPKTALFCKRCNSYDYGRIKRECPSHKNVLFLMDSAYCAVCHVPCEMMQELNLSFDLVQAINAEKMKRLSM